MARHADHMNAVPVEAVPSLATPGTAFTIEARTMETHVDGCQRPGFRYGTTRKSDGKVIMFCKGAKCSARRIV